MAISTFFPVLPGFSGIHSPTPSGSGFHPLTLCTVEGDGHIGGGSSPNRYQPASQGSSSLLGIPLESYRRAPTAYREGLAQRGIISLLEPAHRIGSIPDLDPVWLTFSPFGWHSQEFLELRNYGKAKAYFDAQDEFRIACYGAGLNDETAYVRYRAPGMGMPWTPSLQNRLETFQRSVFGPTGRASYEPRELLLTFLDNGRRGAVEVFENQPMIAEELTRPSLPLVDLFDLYWPEDKAVDSIVHYYRHLSQGREVKTAMADLRPLGQIGHLKFSMTPEEMSQLHHRPLDIATDRLDDQRFHLSVWLEAHAFFEEPLRWITLSKIVRAMQPGSYLLANPMRQTTDKLVAMEYLAEFSLLFGLKFLGLAGSCVQGQGAAALYRRDEDEETPTVRQLADILL